MFEKITIHLKGPICKCKKQNLSWGTYKDNNDRNCLAISCKDCGIRLDIPNNEFVARFSLETEYPEGIAVEFNPGISKEDMDFLKDLRISPDTKAD